MAARLEFAGNMDTAAVMGDNPIAIYASNRRPSPGWGIWQLRPAAAVKGSACKKIWDRLYYYRTVESYRGDITVNIILRCALFRRMYPRCEEMGYL